VIRVIERESFARAVSSVPHPESVQEGGLSQTVRPAHDNETRRAGKLKCQVVEPFEASGVDASNVHGLSGVQRLPRRHVRLDLTRVVFQVVSVDPEPVFRAVATGFGMTADLHPRRVWQAPE
jgi:hypothetical protein